MSASLPVGRVLFTEQQVDTRIREVAEEVGRPL